jgi:hypothetical protein
MLSGFNGIPLALCLEYDMRDGMSWTVVTHNESDFAKIFSRTSIPHCPIVCEEQPCLGALCVPAIRRGLPRWIHRFEIMVALTEDRVPFFLARDSSLTGIDSEVKFSKRNESSFTALMRDLHYEQAIHNRAVSY